MARNPQPQAAGAKTAGGSPPDVKEFLALARKRYDLAAEAEIQIRKDALDDQKFRAGDQWPEDIKTQRQLEGRPCLTINKLTQFLNQITNDQRQNRPSIKVNPADDDASIETAKVFQGLIRHIEYQSNADIAYDNAFEGAAAIGFGYLRITTDYCDHESFDQDIFIRPIKNAFSVHLDPHYQLPDGSDAGWGFVDEIMSKEEYDSQFPGSELSKMEDWASLGASAPGWITKDSARIAEYFYKTFKEDTLHLLDNGETILESDIPESGIPENIKIVKSRKTILPKIKWCKTNGIEILQETDWPGQWIPIVPVLGAEMIIDGKRVLEGIIRHAKDPQRMYNFWATAETETIALAPRAPFIVAEGQIEGHEEQWKTANTKSHAVLQYKPKTIDQILVPPPQRNTYEPPVQAISMARAQSNDDLKGTTGIYDATLGNRSNEQSGVAIMRRNTQAQTSNFHFIDNLSRSLRHVGRICLDLIPNVYDTKRIVRAIQEDGEAEMIPLNQPFMKDGKQIVHNLKKGSYDVTITTGPSFSTKREEAAATMMEFTKSMPQTAPLVADLIVRNMDWPGSQQMADRLKKTLPPGIGEADDNNKQPIPPQAQQQIQQMSSMIDQLTKHLNLANDEIEKKKYELESRERIEMAKIQADIEITLATLNAKAGQELLAHQVGAIQHRLDLLNANQPIEQGNGPAAGDPAAQPSQNQPPTGGASPGSPMGG